MRIGYVLPMGEDTRPGVPATSGEIIALARDVEAAGFDSIWTFDHLLVREKPDAEVLGTWEAWTLLAGIAAVTERARLGVLVSCTGFREPGLLAKMAHTVNDMSDGRLVLGVGAGWHEPEYTAFGYPFDHKVDRFAEAMEIITPMVRTGESTYSGRYYRTEGARMLPATPHRPPMPILIGGRGPRMLELIARHADVWNAAWFSAPGPKFAEQAAAMTAACEKVDRDPATLEISVGLYIKADDASEEAPGVAADPAALADAIAGWRALGVAEILCWMDPPTGPRLDALAAAIAN